jgi:hypothetical protein
MEVMKIGGILLLARRADRIDLPSDRHSRREDSPGLSISINQRKIILLVFEFSGFSHRLGQNLLLSQRNSNGRFTSISGRNVGESNLSATGNLTLAHACTREGLEEYASTRERPAWRPLIRRIHVRPARRITSGRRGAFSAVR